MEQYKNILKEYLPEKSVDFVLSLILKHKLQIKFTAPRLTKYGDYRPPIHRNYHLITLSYNSNKYHVLLTFLHEYAHLLTWIKYKNTVKPHGKEWKDMFRSILLDAIAADIFPEDIKIAIFKQYLQKEAYSAQHNTFLDDVLLKYDTKQSLLVKDVPEGNKFVLKNGMTFIKGEKLRKRYKCINIANKKEYTVHGFAEVYKVLE